MMSLDARPGMYTLPRTGRDLTEHLLGRRQLMWKANVDVDAVYRDSRKHLIVRRLARSQPPYTDRPLQNGLCVQCDDII